MGFKIGDTVRLKSGGADMMIENLHVWEDGSKYACCTWQDNNFAPVAREYDIKVLAIPENKSSTGLK